MDDRLPFASGEARLRLLYELPLTGEERRLLVFGTELSLASALSKDRQSKLSALRFLGPTDGAPAEDGFDAVLMPGTLFEHRDESAAATLKQAFERLAPGGVLVGHCENLLSVRELRAACQARRLLSTSGHRQHAGSAARLERTLQALGFVDAECFHVEPHIASPMALIPAEPHASRNHFVRTVQRNRPLYGRPGYAVRLGLAQAGLGGILQPHLFFWARKPC